MTNKVKIGSLATDEPQNVLCLQNFVTTTNHYSPLKVDGVAYQVPAGYTLHIVKIICSEGVNGGSQALQSATAAVADDAASITGGVVKSPFIYNPLAYSPAEYDILIHFEEETYPCVLSNGGYSRTLCFGYLTENP